MLNRVMRKRLRKTKEVVGVERAIERLRAIQYHWVRMGEWTWRGFTRLHRIQKCRTRHIRSSGQRPTRKGFVASSRTLSASLASIALASSLNQ